MVARIPLVLLAVLPLTVGCRGSSGLSGCQPSQLSAVVYFVPAGAGVNTYQVKITDHGRPCSLTGRPSALVGLTAGGQQRRINTTRMSSDDVTGFTSGKAAELTNALAGEVVIATGIGCQAAQSSNSRPQFSALRLGISGRLIEVSSSGGPEPTDTGISLQCGAAMSGFYAWPPGHRSP